MRTLSLLAFLVSCCLSFSTTAAVNQHHAANVFAGEYKVEGQTQLGLSEFEFSITNAGELAVTSAHDGDNDVSEDGYISTSRVETTSLDSELGPNSVPLLSTTFIGGSDEQTSGLILRFYPEQDGGAHANFLDAVETFNDGPNDFSSVTPNRQLKVFKKNRAGQFERI